MIANESENDLVKSDTQTNDKLEDFPTSTSIESPKSNASKGSTKVKKEKRKLDITSEGIVINSSSGLCVKNESSNKVLSCNQLKQSCPEIFVFCNRLKSYRKMMQRKQSEGSPSERTTQMEYESILSNPLSSSSLNVAWFENAFRCLSAVFCCYPNNGSAVIREVVDSGCNVKLFPFQELVKANGNFPFLGNYRGISQTCSGVTIIKNSLTNLYTKYIPKSDFQGTHVFSINLESRDKLLYMRQLNAIAARFVWRSNGFTQFGFERELEVSGLVRCSFSSSGLIKYFRVYFDPSCVARHAECRFIEKKTAFNPI